MILSIANCLQLEARVNNPIAPDPAEMLNLAVPKDIVPGFFLAEHMEWVARLDLRPRIFVPYVPIEFRRETHVAARFSKSLPAKRSEINLLAP